MRIKGRELDLEGLEVKLGPVLLPLDRDAAGNHAFDPATSLLDGDSISAGSHPLALVRTLASGRTRSSNLAVVDLLPEIAAASHVAAQSEIDLQGRLLGAAADDVVVALYRDGATVRSYDDVVDAPGSPPAQTRRRVRLGAAPVPAGTYRVLLRVNGSQACESPELVLP